MRNYFFTMIVLFSVNVFSQVGIGTSNPQGIFNVDGGKDNAATGTPTALQQSNDFTVTSNGSVGIGTTSPNSSAALEINASNKGFLPPRVTLSSSTDAVTINNPSTGLTVYHMGNSVLESGLYTNTGTSSAPSWNKGKNSDSSGALFYKMIYRGATNNSSKTLKAGLFEWRIVVSGVFQGLQLRLLHPPTGSTVVQGPRVAWLPGNIVTTYNSTASWSSSDWNTWKEIDIQADAASHMLYLDCSNTESFYRVSFTSRRNSFTSLLVELY
ncbi:hypothetical protein KB553_10060 [Chryseobacterium rhizoplanae]|uniref:hypothetical protein n=1 Tax=Chryseobacterium rhizoplanae TaxID=1609531 RepID=UPI001CE365A9|nr:hypothetical protein [Chryseobacterium rhizoplanae]UCA61842.1 hypothetical protein KB553_10060 [Chryseobacterium rhizoplanae]